MDIKLKESVMFCDQFPSITMIVHILDAFGFANVLFSLPSADMNRVTKSISIASAM
jgi:hypothetical protein